MPISMIKTDKNDSIHLASKTKGDDLSIIIAGDLCPMGRSEEFFKIGNIEKLFSGILPTVRDSDLSIVNLECPLTKQWSPILKYGPHLRADPSCAKSIYEAGFNIVSLANNHILDMGEKGLIDTLAACNDAGLLSVGAGINLDHASELLYLEVKNKRIAILSVTEHEFSIAKTNSPGACPLDLINIFYQIKEAQQRSDFILVIVHCGNEYFELPSPGIVKKCHYLVDLGVNAIVCNHVHVPGGMEIYKDTPIIYFNGNFLFESDNEPDEWYKGFLVKFLISPITGTTVELVPYQQSKNDIGITLMDERERQLFLNNVSNLSNIISCPEDLLQKWMAFVNSKQIFYLSMLLNLSKVERKLLQFGLWPFWRLKRSDGIRLLNLFTCESHQELIISLLSEKFLN